LFLPASVCIDLYRNAMHDVSNALRDGIMIFNSPFQGNAEGRGVWGGL